MYRAREEDTERNAQNCKYLPSPHTPTVNKRNRSWHMKHGFVAEHKIRQEILTNRYFPTVLTQNIAQLTLPGLGCYKILHGRHSNFKRFLTIFLTLGWEIPTPQLARLAGNRGHRTIASRPLSTVASFRLSSLPQQPLTCAPRTGIRRPVNWDAKKTKIYFH